MAKMRGLVVAMALLLVASACGGSTTIPLDPQTASAATAAPKLGGPVVLAGPEFDSTVALARRFVDRVGNPDTATDALLIAAENGYSGPQILAGVESGALQADGSIVGVTAARSPLGRIDLEAKSGSAGVITKVSKRPSRGGASSVAVQGEKLLIEQLREVARQGIDAREGEELIGLGGILTILVLLEAGFSPEQVIDSLVLGLFFYESGGRCFSQALPLKENDPVERACDGEPVPAVEPDETVVAPPAPPPVSDAESATYVGDLSGAGSTFVASSITVTISTAGVVTGQLTATEQLENYVASIDFGCGLIDEDEDCSDAVVECPATVQWRSDLASLQFTGTPPDQGAVAGSISVVFDTTPSGCGEPVSETQAFEIAATVNPDGAQITAPFVIDLERVDQPS